MAFRIDNLPSIDSTGRLGRHLPADSAFADAYGDSSIPSIATQVASLGVTLGMDAVRALQERYPNHRDIFLAHHGGAAPSYTTWPDCAYPDTDGCDEPCYGFEPHHMDTFYCATCDEQAADPVHNPPWNWHFHGTRGTLEYMDREPDVCAGRDAWKWKVEGACRQCDENIVFRCHDGWKKYSPDGPLTPTICEGIISCDNQLNLCP